MKHEARGRAGGALQELLEFMGGIAALLLELRWALVPPLVLLLCFVTHLCSLGG